MKILVPIKRVVDPYVKIRVKPDNTGVDTDKLKMTINPFDAIALESALRLRESGLCSDVVVITIGGAGSEETLRHALALGADSALWVPNDDPQCSLTIATLLHEVVKQEQPDLVLMGKQSIDGDNNQTPQMLAALLDWPQATYASQLVLTERTLQVTREIDGGLETLSMTLPAVVSTDLRLNEPRYASLPNIMKAKQKPLRKLTITTHAATKHQQILSVRAPDARKSGTKLETIAQLIDKLRHEAQIL